MDVYAFKSQLPYEVLHNTWGVGYLEIIVDRPKQKGACYRHPDNTASFGSYGDNWEEVRDKLEGRLVEGGCISE